MAEGLECGNCGGSPVDEDANPFGVEVDKCRACGVAGHVESDDDDEDTMAFYWVTDGAK